MSAVDTQLKKAYESEGMSPDEIADDQALDVVAVKAKLMQISSQYRRDCGAEDESALDPLNFTDSQLEEVNQIIYNTARNAETLDGQVDYKTRLAAATYIRDDRKGRKDVVKGIAGQQFNILNFNASMQMAKDKAGELKRLVTQSIPA